MCASHHLADKWRIRLQGVFFAHLWRFEISWHQWVAFSEQSEGCFCSSSPHFLQIRWCVLAVTWALCASSVIKRHQAMNNEKERERDPRRYCFCTPLRQPFRSNWPLVLSPDALVCPSWSRSMLLTALMVERAEVGVYKIKNTDYRAAAAHWWKFSTIFDSICSPQHTDGRLTGRGQTSRRTNSG